MSVIATSLPEVVLISPRVIRDDRGHFFESWSVDRYAAWGIPDRFVQDNVSYSTRGVLRGLHLQHPNGQGKLVSVLRGEIHDVAVDVRRGSPTYGQWCAERLSAENARQLYVPPGFAHGFLVIGEEALVMYKVTAAYHPESELTIAWNDPDLDIAWPLDGAPHVSPRDAAAPRLREVSLERLPSHGTPVNANGVEAVA
ncbi:MAG: dTDP-4-dehydrorhamnose 3,5-epimerase [Gemmatirosa sp.]